MSIIAPYSGGSLVAIDSYEVLFKNRDGSSFSASSECDGSTVDFKNNLYCDVSLTTLTAAPFNLQRGDEIVAIVKAANVLGAGQYSSNSSSSTALIVSIPDDPTNSPIRIETGST